MKMKIKIKSGNYDILYSGTVIQVQDEKIELTLPDGDNKGLELIINFADDENEKGQTTKYNLLDNNTLEMTLVNFNSSAGIGNTEILKLGTLNNRELYLNYRVFNIKKLGKTLHYTFYSGKEVENA